MIKACADNINPSWACIGGCPGHSVIRNITIKQYIIGHGLRKADLITHIVRIVGNRDNVSIAKSIKEKISGKSQVASNTALIPGSGPTLLAS